MRKKLTKDLLFDLVSKLKQSNFFWAIFWGTVFTVFTTWYAEGVPDWSIQTTAGLIVGWVAAVGFTLFILSQGSYQQSSGKEEGEQDLPDFLPISRVDELVARTLEKEPIEDR